MARNRSHHHAVHNRTAPMSPRAARRDAPTHTPHKTFNCIVDESALIAGVKAADLQQWIMRGDICMYVPLQSKLQLSFRHLTLGSSNSSRSAAATQ